MINLYKVILCLYSLVIMLISFTPINAQGEKISSSIIKETCLFTTGEGVSNILKVTNNDSLSTLSFTLSVAHPENWRFLGDKLKVYFLPPKDSLFLPIRIIPIGLIKGNTKFIISCYLYDVEKEVTISSNFFFIKKPKISSWKLTAEPSNLLYLKNGQDKVNFAFNVHNFGTEEEDLVLKLIPNQTQKIIITDSLGSPVKNLKTSFVIQPGDDTTFEYSATLKERVRNFSRVSLLEPNLNNHKQRFNIYANSKQSIFFDTKTNINSHIELRHLPNNTFVNEFSRFSIPVTISTVFSNIGSPRPVSNTNLNGVTTLPNNAKIYYNSHLFLGAGDMFNPQNFTFNLSYTTNKFNVSTGNVGLQGGLAGRGVRGSYNFKNFTLGGLLTLSPTLFNSKGITYGLFSSLNPLGRISLTNSYMRSTLNNINQTTMNFFSLRPRFKTKNNNLSGSLGVNIVNTNTTNPLTAPNRTGIFLVGNLSSRYLNQRVNTSIGLSSYSGAPGAIGVYTAGSMNYNHSTSFKLNNKWKFSLINNYNSRDSINPSFSNFSNLNNMLRINGEINGVSFTPQIFYNIVTLNDKSYLAKGFTYYISNFDFVKNKRLSFVFTLGNKKQLRDTLGLPLTPFFLGNLNFKYRVWQGFISYSRGSINATDILLYGTNPRSNLLFSISNQYQFKNPRIILDNNITFRTNTKNSITINPQLYYFTKNKFRLYFNPGIFWSKVKRPEIYAPEAPPIIPSTGTFVNFGIQKKIGIPVPNSQTKKILVSTKFLAFIDNNGNHKKDIEESYLENIVINMGENEVITNSVGEASINNIQKDSLYNLSVFSVDYLNGFFPYYFKDYLTQKDSTINIPFVKGVKVYGEIYIDRDKTNEKFETRFDLGNLRVSAFNGVDVYTLTDSKGKFSLYVPFGEYVISIDEDMLGNKFKCLENNFELTLDESTSSVFVTFYLVEKRKKITIKKF